MWMCRACLLDTELVHAVDNDADVEGLLTRPALVKSLHLPRAPRDDKGSSLPKRGAADARDLMRSCYKDGLISEQWDWIASDGRQVSFIPRNSE